MASATPLDDVLNPTQALELAPAPETAKRPTRDDTNTLAASQFSHSVTVQGYVIGPTSVVHFKQPPEKINKCCMAAKLLGLFMFIRILVLTLWCAWAVISFLDIKINLLPDPLKKASQKWSVDWFFIPELFYHFSHTADALYYTIMAAFIVDLQTCLIFSMCGLMMDDIKGLIFILSLWVLFQLLACSAYMWAFVQFILVNDYLMVYYVDILLCVIIIVFLICNIVALCRLSSLGYKSFNDQYQVELRQMYYEQQLLKDMMPFQDTTATDTTVPTSMTDTTVTTTAAPTMGPSDIFQTGMTVPLIHEPPIQLHVLPDGTPDPNYPYHPPDAYHPTEYHYHHYHQEDIDAWRRPTVKPDLQGFLDHQQQHTTTVVVKSKKHHKHHRKKPKKDHHHKKK